MRAASAMYRLASPPANPLAEPRSSPSAKESGDRGKDHATVDDGAAGILQPGLAHARSSVCEDHACPREHQ